MGQIGIITAERNPSDIALCINTLDDIGGNYRFIDETEVLSGRLEVDTTGLLVTDGPQFLTDDPRDTLSSGEMNIIQQALDRDLPVLCIGRGLHLLNMVEGGQEPVSLQSNHSQAQNSGTPTHQHQIFLAPGAKTSATMGTTGFFKVNSYHEFGIYDKQKSHNLMAMAYSVDDGLIEILESPNHSWVVATQFNLEKLDELPRLFVNLFMALVERSQIPQEI